MKKNHPELPPNVYKFTVRNRVEFRWRKNKNSVSYMSDSGFGTLEEAIASMKAEFDNAVANEQSKSPPTMSKYKTVRTVRVPTHAVNQRGVPAFK